MAVRRRVVRAHPDTGQVAREEMREAFLDFEAQIACSGGTLTVVVERAPTEMPLEMVTTRALFEWKDRTDAKEREEDQLHVFTQQQVESLFAELDGLDAAEPEMQVQAPVGGPAGHAVDDDPELEVLEAIRAGAPDVDEASIPEDLR